MSNEVCARRIRVRGVVQGVGFRPYVFRLAHDHRLRGWVVNGTEGVSIHVEGTPVALQAFIRALPVEAPPAAAITGVDVSPATVEAFERFEIRPSESDGRLTTRISPDLPVCADCLGELFDPRNRRSAYPYINCTNCGPRFSIICALPYDRVNTTMAEWLLCDACAAEYHNPLNRRFHAQPVACDICGPHYTLQQGANIVRSRDAIGGTVRLLHEGKIVAVKGLGGYHLVCDADNAASVAELRVRKYRKDQAFAVMARDLPAARAMIEVSPTVEALLLSNARPIVLAPARVQLPGVAPDNRDLGVMLPYAPVHHLLFAEGAPERLVMTSGNRSSEPIAYRDDDALRRLSGLADAFLMGERPIARRVDDSIVRGGRLGPTVLRRSRGLAPGAVATLPAGGPILAVGGDLKNTITLVVDGQAYVSQHIGDLEHADSRQAFSETILDLVSMYDVKWDELTVVHDAHPQYATTAHAAGLRARQHLPVQHHRAHVASVLVERQEFDRRVVGVGFDGTGYGDDGAIWGGEFFVGSIRGGFERAAHLRTAALPGGDAAARNPVQAAAGFLSSVEDLPDLTLPPFNFPQRYQQAREVVQRGFRSFPTTSVGRLFDTVAAVAGFTAAITFEGQAAMWLEQLARHASEDVSLQPAGLSGSEVDWRPLLRSIVEARQRGASPSAIARAFHQMLARATAEAASVILAREKLDVLVLSGGVMQNQLLVEEIHDALPTGVTVWINHEVPANDGGISLGQAALAAGRT
jgi:hydrogenase maturation protein HypF